MLYLLPAYIQCRSEWKRNILIDQQLPSHSSHATATNTTTTTTTTRFIRFVRRFDWTIRFGVAHHYDDKPSAITVMTVPTLLLLLLLADQREKERWSNFILGLFPRAATLFSIYQLLLTQTSTSAELWPPPSKAGLRFLFTAFNLINLTLVSVILRN